MVRITCTILMVHLPVMPGTVARTRHKCKQSIYVYIFYHFTKVGFIVITKVTIQKKDSTYTVTSVTKSAYNNFSKERKSEIGQRTTFKPFCRL